MAGDTKVNGLTTTWKAWESIFGTMAVSTKASIKMTRSMALVCILGQMVAVMRGTGTKGSSMG